MIKLAYFIAGTFSSAAAQVLIKNGVGNHASFLSSFFSWQLMLAVTLYLLSFVSYAAFLRNSELSVASPLFVGGVVLLIFVYGIYGGETITLLRMLGAALVIAGIFLIQLSVG